MYLGIDVHKRYAQVAVMDEAGEIVEEVRVENANLFDSVTLASATTPSTSAYASPTTRMRRPPLGSDYFAHTKRSCTNTDHYTRLLPVCVASSNTT